MDPLTFAETPVASLVATTRVDDHFLQKLGSKFRTIHNNPSLTFKTLQLRSTALLPATRSPSCQHRVVRQLQHIADVFLHLIGTGGR